MQSLTLKGTEGEQQIAHIMESFRQNPPKELAGVKSRSRSKIYQASLRKEMDTGKLDPIKLPKSNVLKYFLEDGSWFCARPSGTEPKCKFYFAVQGDSLDESETLLKNLEEAVMQLVHELVK